MIHGKKVVVVLPAYNAERTLELTLADLPADVVDEVILVDDASRDNTAALAHSLGVSTFVHANNQGYGGNQKTCYSLALAHGADRGLPGSGVARESGRFLIAHEHSP